MNRIYDDDDDDDETDRTIPNNKPDIIIRDNKEGTCMLTDVEISGDRNVIKKVAEKIVKYKDLTTETRRMWNVKTNVMPVIIGATLTVSKSLRKYLSNTPGSCECGDELSGSIKCGEFG